MSPMALPVQLISTDFDGTIFAEFENPPVPAGLQELLRDLQSRGVRWAINTGRDLTGLMEALARARLTVRPDYLVLVEREIYVHEGARYVGLEDWNRRCAEDHARLFARVRADVPRLTAWINARFDADVYEDPWSPLCLLARSNGDADAIEDFLQGYCRSAPNLTVVRNDVYARFSHAAYSKGAALAEISRRLGIARQFVFAAGDHLNDLPMLSLEVAGYLVAPANAVPLVKDAVRRQGGIVSDLPHGFAIEAALRAAVGLGPAGGT
jgi:hydroxymethylpyrimidine pyrophosphatase-like HAD family hydrolase